MASLVAAADRVTKSEDTTSQCMQTMLRQGNMLRVAEEYFQRDIERWRKFGRYSGLHLLQRLGEPPSPTEAAFGKQD